MSPPRPGAGLIVCSLAAIVFCTILCAVFTASILHPWSMRGLGGLLLLPGILGLALTQYAATFQGKTGSAETAARLYGFGGGFMILVLVCVVLDVLRVGERPSWPVVALGGLCVLFAVWGRWGGRMNGRWADRLRQFEEQLPEGADEQPEFDSRPAASPLAVRRSVKLLAAVVFLGASVLFYGILAPKVGEHLPVDETPLILPAAASDVCYWLYAGDSVFEFSISEAEFLAWAKDHIQRRGGKPDSLTPIEEPARILRYDPAGDRPSPRREVVIDQGYHAAWLEYDRAFAYAYDASAGRAYHSSTSR